MEEPLKRRYSRKVVCGISAKQARLREILGMNEKPFHRYKTMKEHHPWLKGRDVFSLGDVEPEEGCSADES